MIFPRVKVSVSFHCGLHVCVFARRLSRGGFFSPADDGSKKTESFIFLSYLVNAFLGKKKLIWGMGMTVIGKVESGVITFC